MNFMKVLVTGAMGQLGYDVVEELKRQGQEVIALDIQDMDITREKQVMEIMANVEPDAVIHCAAWTAVDAAEDNENVERVFDINSRGTSYIAKACKMHDCKMIYISTDYVFEGTGINPMKPNEACKPIGIYGKSKFEGELAVREILDKFFIVRISWVFGINGNNFVKTMLKLGKTRDELSVVNDQIGTPTYTYDLSKLLVSMINSKEYGIYHATNEGGFISWFDFASEIMKQASKYDSDYENVRLIPVGSEAYSTKATRPLNSRLDTSALSENGFEPLGHWKDALAHYVEKVVN